MPVTITKRVQVNSTFEQIRTYDADGKLIGIRNENLVTVWVAPRLSLGQFVAGNHTILPKGSGEAMA